MQLPWQAFLLLLLQSFLSRMVSQQQKIGLAPAADYLQIKCGKAAKVA